MISDIKLKPRKPDWWGKTLAGGLLGFSLAFCLCGLFAWLSPGGIATPNKVQLVMWMIAPLWMLVFSLSFMFRSGLRAFFWLGFANLVAIASLAWVRGATLI